MSCVSKAAGRTGRAANGRLRTSDKAHDLGLTPNPTLTNNVCAGSRGRQGSPHRRAATGVEGPRRGLFRKKETHDGVRALMFRSCVHIKVGLMVRLVCYTRPQPCRQGRGGGFVGLGLPYPALRPCRKWEENKWRPSTRDKTNLPCRVFGRRNLYIQIGKWPWRIPVLSGSR